MQAQGAEPLLSMRGMVKDFPGVRALDGVDFDLHRGEVHGLVGENGAGKSTLLKILSGALRADAGQIRIEGHPVLIHDPRRSRELGIAVIYQEFSLVPYLDIARNVFLGHESEVGSGLVLRHVKMRREATRLLSDLHSDLDPRRLVVDLSVAEKQLVEIVRALSQRSKIVLMDEPSAPLSEREVEVLFQTIRTLKSRGVTIVYVSHRLEELAQITDRISILRDGRLVQTRATAEIGMSEIIRLMVGREISDHYPKERLPRGESLLEVTGIGGPDGIPLQVYKGEVVGLAGLVGAGRTELARVIFGADQSAGQRLRLEGREVHPRSPAEAIRCGIGMVPEDRKVQGLVLEMAVRENITMPLLPQLFNGLTLDRRRQRQIAQGQVDQLRIHTPSLEQRTLLLSGGNQQKVVLAKWLARQCRLLILDEPTRGIDVGAKFEMYKIMNELTRQGKGVLMISSDLPELIAMSDRIYVMRGGRILAEYPGGSTDQETIMSCIAQGGQ
jgi:ribose transport system ATP-binding protein